MVPPSGLVGEERIPRVILGRSGGDDPSGQFGREDASGHTGRVPFLSDYERNLQIIQGEDLSGHTGR